MNKALFFVLVTIALDAIGIGIIIPVLPQLVQEVTGYDADHSQWHYSVIVTVFAFFQFLFSPLIGNLSDAYGRRPILLFSVLGMGLDYLFMVFAPSFTWLIIGRAISGIFGASFTTAAAYIADVSSKEEKVKNFGLIGAAFGFGFVVGPAIGGLVGELSPRAPFVVAAILSLVNFLFGLFVLKESLPASNRRKFQLKRANPFGAIRQIWRFKEFKVLFLVTFLVIFSNMSVHNLWVFYTQKRFDWNELSVGISLSIAGVFMGVVQGVLAHKIATKYGIKKAAFIGFMTLVVSFMGFGFSTNGWMIYVLLIPYSLSGLIEPNIRAIVSGDVPDNEQGELQGIFTSLMSLAEIIAPVLFLAIYHYSIPFAGNNELVLGSAFFIAALIGCFAWFLFQKVMRNRSTDDVKKN